MDNSQIVRYLGRLNNENKNLRKELKQITAIMNKEFCLIHKKIDIYGYVIIDGIRTRFYVDDIHSFPKTKDDKFCIKGRLYSHSEIEWV
jgi:hypothetical protein